ncbi:hypothetical protein MKW94_012185 [Papaver nudicaule]|uniref:AP2/ERF domain-containing protein n=1 Tax=Papaver nudicaule TaxID=74823 RepID=A0AA41RVY7_PAPNU|nr:hypothetical protein [Papaver nudicaule]
MENFPHNQQLLQQVDNTARRRSRHSSKYLGVRRRPWGRYAAEIRNPFTKERHWLGTFDTEEEAALTYDLSAISISGLGRARTNFYYPFLVPLSISTASPQPSQTPPPTCFVPCTPPPPTPKFEEETSDCHLRQQQSYEDLGHEIDAQDNDESMTIAAILESFCSSL